MSVITNMPFDKDKIEYVVACSGGNDSIALLQYMLDNYELGTFLALYNDTGWAREDWPLRIKDVSQKCRSLNVPFVSTQSIGFRNMVRKHKGFPMPASAMQFCTSDLKTGPTLLFLNNHDPEKEWVVVTGRRREESQNRAGLALIEEDTKVYQGRDVLNPLITHDERERDILIRKFGFEPLPHSSMECFPCVCSKKSDINMLPDYPGVITVIKDLEIEMGHTSNGKPRVMFRPYRSGGAVGIEQVMIWANGKRGTKLNKIPKEHQIPKVDYSGYRGNMKPDERAKFWGDIKQQCIDLGYNLKDLPTDIAYDDDTDEGKDFSRQCDGGLCGN